MILNERNKKPILTFGLGRTSLATPIGSTIRVEQIQILNPDNYKMTLNSVPVDLYSFEYNAVSLGVQKFEVSLINSITRVEILSDAIEVEVTLRTDSNIIKVDNNIITVDND